MSGEQSVGKECGFSENNNTKIMAYINRKTNLGQLEISRALPIREHRLVGPWCFLDRFGPLSFSEGTPMNVPPHPHIGLQTVTWLLEGEVQHTDSINSKAVVHPGGVNIMTAGKGIAHAETTPVDNTGKLNGVQLWTALPEKYREIEPGFEGIQEVPVVKFQAGIAHVFAGSFNKITSPGTFYSELIGLDLALHPGRHLEMDLDPQFEHAALILNGDCKIEDRALEKQTLYYLGPGRSCLPVQSDRGCRLLLIGGIPFQENILMWWNFVARTPEEIKQARTDWEEHKRFGNVRGEHKQRLNAPTLTKFAQPNPAS